MTTNRSVHRNYSIERNEIKQAYSFILFKRGITKRKLITNLTTQMLALKVLYKLTHVHARSSFRINHIYNFFKIVEYDSAVRSNARFERKTIVKL